MADRTPGALPPSNWRGMLEQIATRFASIERRLSSIESRSGQTLPPDYRFGTNEAGDLTITRVSTGATTIIDV